MSSRVPSGDPHSSFNSVLVSIVTPWCSPTVPCVLLLLLLLLLLMMMMVINGRGVELGVGGTV